MICFVIATPSHRNTAVSFKYIFSNCKVKMKRARICGICDFWKASVCILVPVLTLLVSLCHQAWVLQTHRAVRRIHHVPRPAFSTGEGTKATVPGACAQGRCGQALGKKPILYISSILKMLFTWKYYGVKLLSSCGFENRSHDISCCPNYNLVSSVLLL